MLVRITESFKEIKVKMKIWQAQTNSVQIGESLFKYRTKVHAQKGLGIAASKDFMLQGLKKYFYVGKFKLIFLNFLVYRRLLLLKA